MAELIQEPKYEATPCQIRLADGKTIYFERIVDESGIWYESPGVLGGSVRLETLDDMLDHQGLKHDCWQELKELRIRLGIYTKS